MGAAPELEGVPSLRSAAVGGAGVEIAGQMTVASSSDRGWDGIEVEEVVHQVDDFSIPAATRHLLVFHLDRPLEAAERRHRRGGVLREGSLTILPAGEPTDWHLDRHGDVRHLHLHLEPPFLKRVAAEVGLNPQGVELVPSVGACSPEAEQIGLALLLELRSGGVGGKILADSLATQLSVQLLRHHTASSALPSPPSREALTGAAFKRVTEYIEEHLAEDLPLRTIASVASMSPFHFTRLFRTATGLSPHQYIIHRRVERAKLLMTGTDWSHAAIAREVGFANGSHLALHFKRRTGVAPHLYRSYH